MYGVNATQKDDNSILFGFICHKSDGHTVPILEGFKITNNQQCMKWTAAGWKMSIEFSDSTLGWLPLWDAKYSNPEEMVEFTIASRIDKEPALSMVGSTGDAQTRTNDQQNEKNTGKPPVSTGLKSLERLQRPYSLMKKTEMTFGIGRFPQRFASFSLYTSSF